MITSNNSHLEEQVRVDQVKKKKTIREEILDLCSVKDSDYLTLLPDPVKKSYKGRFKHRYKHRKELSFAELDSIREAKLAEERQRKRDYLVEIGKFTRDEVEKLNDLEVEIAYYDIDNIVDKINLQKDLLYKEQLTNIEKAELYGNYPINEDALQYIFSYIVEYEQVQSRHYMSRFFNYSNLSHIYKLSVFNLEPNYISTPIAKPQSMRDLRQIYERRLISTYEKTNDQRVLPYAYRRYNKFFYYRYAYMLLKNTLFRNHIRYMDISDQEYPKMTGDMIVEYLKHKHYKYPNYLWHVIFQDPIIEKLVNIFIKNGKKEKCERMLMRIFFLLNNNYSLNPIYILKNAIENLRPYLCAKTIPFGRRTKLVPHPVSEKKQFKLVLKWIKTEVHLNKKPVPLHYKIIEVLLNAFASKGYAYSQMMDMHDKAYNNRMYMYSNYYLKSTKVKHLRPF